MTSVWGVSAVAILDSSVNCVCVRSTKKLTMPAYCVATNCNNSQTTPGITMHELPHNWPAVRQKWINLYNSNELTSLLRRITPICVASTSVSVISQTPWNTAWGFAPKLTWCSGTLSKSCLTPVQTPVKLIRLYPCGSLGQSVRFVFGARVGHFAATPQSDVVGI